MAKILFAEGDKAIYASPTGGCVTNVKVITANIPITLMVGLTEPYKITRPGVLVEVTATSSTYLQGHRFVALQDFLSPGHVKRKRPRRRNMRQS